MVRISSSPDAGLGIASQKIIEHWNSECFGVGMSKAARLALEVGPRNSGLLDRGIRKLLSWYF